MFLKIEPRRVLEKSRCGGQITITIMRKWQCIACGWIYDEALGYDEEDMAPGTRWEDVPEDFVCPECGVSKEDFEMIEIG